MTERQDERDNSRPADRSAQTSPENYEAATQDRYQEISQGLHPTVSDKNEARLDPQLQFGDADEGGRKTVAQLNEHLDKLASGDARDLPKLLTEPNTYNKYKADLTTKVFDPNGKVRESATEKDILKLVDLNNAEAAAMKSRFAPATKGIDQARTMNEFSDGRMV